MGPGANNHSIIVLTLSSPSVELNWCLLVGDATGSDHEVIEWEVLGAVTSGVDKNTETTGSDISGWDPTKESGEEDRKKPKK